jgi:hypothetical protein
LHDYEVVMKVFGKAFGIALLALAAAPAHAQSLPAAYSDYAVAFGPFVGGGSISTGSTVKNVNGYALSVERHWRLSQGLSLGPVLDVSNAFVETKDHKAGQSKMSGTYDNRLFMAGVRLSQAVGNDQTLAQTVYLTLLGGRGYSKLSQTDAAPAATTQTDFGNIRGTAFAGELGAFLPLKGSFGINLAFAASQYKVDQSQATGTYAGDRIVDGVLSLTEGSYTADDNGLERSVTMRSYAGKLGVSLGF